MSEPFRFCWNELLSVDVEADKRFYKSVFGWEAEDKKFGDTLYTLFKKDGVEIAGMMAAPDECKSADSSWLSYVTVTSVNDSVNKALAAGGKTVLPKMCIEEVGEIAVVISATGGPIGFYKPVGSCK